MFRSVSVVSEGWKSKLNLLGEMSELVGLGTEVCADALEDELSRVLTTIVLVLGEGGIVDLVNEGV